VGAGKRIGAAEEDAIDDVEALALAREEKTEVLAHTQKRMQSQKPSVALQSVTDVDTVSRAHVAVCLILYVLLREGLQIFSQG
jgi:hypothetical protein